MDYMKLLSCRIHCAKSANDTVVQHRQINNITHR